MLTIATQIAPDNLINPKGLPHFGHFDGIVKTLGLADFAYFDTMDKPASAWAKHFDYKQFQFVSLVTPRYVLGHRACRYCLRRQCFLLFIRHKNQHTHPA